MAGTADNWLTTAIVKGPGKAYANLGGTPAAGLGWDGAAGARLLLHTDGTPNSTQNPLAVHLGMTEGGTTFSVKPTFTDFYADEFTDPIATQVTQDQAVIGGSLLQLVDMTVQAIMIPTATRSDLGGAQGLSFGGATTLVYTSVAVIFPLEGATKWGVFHLYKAFNDQGLAGQITSKKLGASPFAFRGLAITTRSSGDQVGYYFRQVSGAS